MNNKHITGAIMLEKKINNIINNGSASTAVERIVKEVQDHYSEEVLIARYVKAKAHREGVQEANPLELVDELLGKKPADTLFLFGVALVSLVAGVFIGSVKL